MVVFCSKSTLVTIAHDHFLFMLDLNRSSSSSATRFIGRRATRYGLGFINPHEFINTVG